MTGNFVYSIVENFKMILVEVGIDIFKVTLKGLTLFELSFKIIFLLI